MLWILDAGHGIETPGKRSPGKKTFDDGRLGILEYEFNRAVVARIAAELDRRGMDYHIMCQSDAARPLRDRVRIANAMTEAWEGRAALISVHANAAGKGGWSNARGFRVFHAHSPVLARMMQVNVDIEMYEWAGKTAVKKAGFTMIKLPRCEAILTENGFMTNREDAAMLARDSVRDRIAAYHVKTILDFEDYYNG